MCVSTKYFGESNGRKITITFTVREVLPNEINPQRDLSNERHRKDKSQNNEKYHQKLNQLNSRMFKCYTINQHEHALRHVCLKNVNLSRLTDPIIGPIESTYSSTLIHIIKHQRFPPAGTNGLSLQHKYAGVPQSIVSPENKYL